MRDLLRSLMGLGAGLLALGGAWGAGARAATPDCPDTCARFDACFVGVPTAASAPARFGPYYGRAGHYSSPFIVAIAAGHSPSDAGELALWSEYADEDPRLNAISALCQTLDLGHEEQVYLHSLRGEDACPVRDTLARLIRAKTRPWVRGLLIHALGDAYAHARDCDSGPGACCSDLYGWPIGHAFAFHTPDYIRTDTPKYTAYLETLFRALEVPAGSSQHQIVDDLAAFVACEAFPSDDGDEEFCALNCFAQKKGLPTKADAIAAPPLTREQIEAWFDWVKAGGASPPPGGAP